MRLLTRSFLITGVKFSCEDLADGEDLFADECVPLGVSIDS